MAFAFANNFEVTMDDKKVLAFSCTQSKSSLRDLIDGVERAEIHVNTVVNGGKLWETHRLRVNANETVTRVDTVGEWIYVGDKRNVFNTKWNRPINPIE